MGDSRPDSERRPLLSRTSTAYESDAASSIRPNELSAPSTPRALALGTSVFILIFILTSNVSLMTTIQSPIAEELHASSEVTWFNSAYLIAITSLTPIAGKLCQTFTPRVHLLVSIMIQSVGLLVTSQAPTVRMFLAGRAVCGVGSAAVTPVAFILVSQLVPIKRRAIFFGLINTGYTTGLACGAIVAGALEPIVGWRTVFWMQIPLTMTAAITVFLTIPNRQKLDTDDTIAQKLGRIDYFGVFTLISSLVLMLYALSAPKLDLRSTFLAAGMFVLFVLVESKWATEPIVPPSVMRSRANVFTGISTVGVMTARWAILFYTPAYAIAVRNWAPSAAGALLIPTNAGFALGGIIAGWLHIKRTGSFYVPTLVCFALFGSLQLFMSQLLTEDSALWLFITCLFFNGFVVGGLLNYSLAHLLHMTPTHEHFIVIPFNATFRSFSGSFGAAISGGYFLRTLYQSLYSGFESIGLPHNGDLVRRLLGSPYLVQKLEGKEKEVAINAYMVALKATFLVGVGLAVVTLIIQAGVGWNPSEAKDKKPALRGDEIERVLSRESAVN